MTLLRLMPLFLATIGLSACMPENEISQENADAILSINSRISQVAELTQKSFTSTHIDNPSLQRFLPQQSATMMTDSCVNDEGSFLFSKSVETGQFSLVFDQCQGADGGILDGSLSGDFTAEDNAYITSLTGELSARKKGQLINVDAITLDIEFLMNDSPLARYVSQEGDFQINDKDFQGVISVDTKEPVGIDDTTLNVSGYVTYKDDSGNELVVDHTNNGLHLYYNSLYLTTYQFNAW